MTAKPASTSLRPTSSPIDRRARGAEDRDGRTGLGERAEALDELRLDPQDAPWIGVDPVGQAAGVEEALVGGAALVHLAATLDDGTRHAVGLPVVA
jgi:hypothetical protein